LAVIYRTAPPADPAGTNFDFTWNPRIGRYRASTYQKSYVDNSSPESVDVKVYARFRHRTNASIFAEFVRTYHADLEQTYCSRGPPSPSDETIAQCSLTSSPEKISAYTYRPCSLPGGEATFYLNSYYDATIELVCPFLTPRVGRRLPTAAATPYIVDGGIPDMARILIGDDQSPGLMSNRAAFTSSIKVGSPLMIFSEPNYGGQSLLITKDVLDLSSYPLGSGTWNDHVYSVRLNQNWIWGLMAAPASF